MAITKIGTPELFDFSATNTALQLPTGDTASRPATPSTGEWRFNSQLKYVEYYDGGAWRQIDTESAAVFTPSENFNTNTYFGTGATQAIDAKFNEAANFNGTSSVISIPLNVVSVSSAYTVSLWFNAVNVGVNTGIFSNQGTSAISNQIGINIISSTQINLASIVNNGSNTVDIIAATVPTMSNITWYNLVVVADRSLSNKVKLYLNGVEASNYNVSASAGSNTLYSTAQIGRSDGRFMNGKLDQVRIFNTALPATGTGSVATLYAETTTTAATLNFPAGAGCVAAYQLDGDASDISGTYGGVETDIGYTGLQFQPDFVWVKQRSGTRDPIIADTVRGPATNFDLLYPYDSFPQSTNVGPEFIRSIQSNGFTIGNHVYVSEANETYVAWSLKAGGTPTATNSAGAGNVPTAGSVKIDGVDSTTALAGTIAATKISANTVSGFSIVKANSSSSGVFTVGHGLNAAPELYIIKNLDSAGGWLTYVKLLGADKYLQLNNSDIAGTSTNFWDNTLATTTVFTMKSGSVISPNVDFSAYCWHSVSGYQKIGTYTGNGGVNTISTEVTSGDGGFEPAFVIVKGSSNSGSWIMYDNKRSTTNPRNKVIYADSTASESTNTNLNINFLTNGFQLTGTDTDYNGSGRSFIYLAIAADKDTSVPTLANSFSPTLYTGNGGTQDIFIPFTPDFTWVKDRDTGYQHNFYDSIRGATNAIEPNSTSATYPLSGLTSFNTNGFTLGSNAGNNQINSPNVSWNWKAGGLPTINSDGSITSIVSANQAAGFSIVKWTGDGSSSATVGHGISTPHMIITKSLGETNDWNVNHVGMPNKIIYLQSGNAAFSGGGTNGAFGYQSTNTATTFQFTAGSSSVNNVNKNNVDYIAYCFHSIAGYQKLGSYTGNRPSTKTVYTTDNGLVGGANGFRPRFLMIKDSSNSGEDWIIVDSKREGASAPTKVLYPNTASSEDSYTVITFTSNGFTVGNTGLANTNGATIIYLAIA